MGSENEKVRKILDENPIEGVDYKDGITRFGNQPTIYLRIVKSFIKNTPDTLETLAGVTPDTLSDYAIRIHGLKGSCYGISAMRLGDEAKALELASKDDDWATVEQGNPTVIEHVRELIAQLDAIVDKVERDEDADDQRPVADAPDRALLRELLDATCDFDVEGMQQAIDKLDAVRYRTDPRLVSNLREQLTNFRYDLIEDKARELLT